MPSQRATREVVPAFLVVEDDLLAARSIERVLARWGPSVIVATAGQARDELARREQWLGFVIDVHLRRHSGLDVLTDARIRWPRVEAIVLTGDNRPAIINRAAKLGAVFACKPLDRDTLVAFAERCFERAGPEQEAGSELSQSRTRVLEKIAARADLTKREGEIVRCYLEGVPSKEIGPRLGIRPGTLRNHVSSILRKTAHPSLRSLLVELMHMVSAELVKAE